VLCPGIVASFHVEQPAHIGRRSSAARSAHGPRGESLYGGGGAIPPPKRAGRVAVEGVEAGAFSSSLPHLACHRFGPKRTSPRIRARGKRAALARPARRATQHPIRSIPKA